MGVELSSELFGLAGWVEGHTGDSLEFSFLFFFSFSLEPRLIVVVVVFKCNNVVAISVCVVFFSSLLYVEMF